MKNIGSKYMIGTDTGNEFIESEDDNNYSSQHRDGFYLSKGVGHIVPLFRKKSLLAIFGIFRFLDSCYSFFISLLSINKHEKYYNNLNVMFVIVHHIAFQPFKEIFSKLYVS